MEYVKKLKACIGCGYCCRKAPCGLPGVEWKSGQCSELVWDKSSQCWRYRKVLESGIKSKIAEQLSIGAGCCSGLNTYQRFQYIPTLEDLKHEDVLVKKLERGLNG